MPTPQFILDIRASIGHSPLWLPGVSAVVFNEHGEVLLGRRADNGRWTLITGIPEPAEDPAAAAVREIEEETGVRARVQRVVSCGAIGPMTYPNGDECSFMDITFRCEVISGEARVNDDESTQVGWFSVEALPENLNERHRRSITLALPVRGETVF